MTGPGAGTEHDLVRAQDVPEIGPDSRRERADRGAGAGTRLPLRSVVAGAAGALAMVTAVLLARKGIHTDDFPPFLNGASATPITRYSGPWLTAAAGAALLAALLLLLAVGDLARRARSRRSAVISDGSSAPLGDVIGPTSS